MKSNMDELDIKWENLLLSIRQMKRVAVAFSAGVDSTLLLEASREALGNNVLAITGRLAAFPLSEADEAERFCRLSGIKQVSAEVDQLAIPHFADNPPDRCYICKKALFTEFINTARENGFSILLEGSNADDVNDYRPGMRAVAELGVKSPLKTFGFTKQEIRKMSKRLGLPTHNKPSLACLATRFPYGERITSEKLAAVDNAERFLRGLGFGQARVRCHGNLARIEVEQNLITEITRPEIRRKIYRLFESLGFLYTSVDLNGYQTGSMNKQLNLK